VLAEVAGEPDGSHAGVGGVQALQQREALVPGTVVDEDELVRAAEPVERLGGAPVELVEGALLVQDRDDDREVGGRLGLVARADCEEICLERSQSATNPSAPSLPRRYARIRV